VGHAKKRTAHERRVRGATNPHNAGGVDHQVLAMTFSRHRAMSRSGSDEPPHDLVPVGPKRGHVATVLGAAKTNELAITKGERRRLLQSASIDAACPVCDHMT
jgi:hypothetical protein